MTEVPFHATRMGRTFFEHTTRELVKQLAKLNENLEAAGHAVPESGHATAVSLSVPGRIETGPS